jgi:hypothetical protein
MAQLQSNYDEVRIPFNTMSFSPDVPTANLQPNEYNDGRNIECDVRGIRSVAGDISILDNVPGIPTFLTGGYRQNGEFWFIVASYTVDPDHPTDPSYNQGRWYARTATVDWYEITPGGNAILGYKQNTNITECWNGTVPFFNDTLTPPMFLTDSPGTALTQYANNANQSGISSATVNIDGTVTLDLTASFSTKPYLPDSFVDVNGLSPYFDGRYRVKDSTTTSVTYYDTPVTTPPTDLSLTTVKLTYIWNYNPQWESYTAGFLRMYSTPNVGSILVAGDLTVKYSSTYNVEYPVTVQWSQAFGLNDAPITWQPTITNVANQLEVPARGTCVDAFPSNGQFFVCSYWDTVIFTPMNYSTTSTPILGVRLYNQGRGLLSSNCWANTDQNVYGIDARDIWVFDGQNFTGIGNQRVKNWFFDQLNPLYYSQIFMECNTQKNQIEIYYPDSNAVNGVPNKMLSYRYDLQVWNAPRDVTSATMSCESPVWTTPDSGATWTFNPSSRTIVYAQGILNGELQQKDYGYQINNHAITSFFRRDNIKLLKDYSGKLMVHRILPEVVNLGGVPFTGDYNKQLSESTGRIRLTVEGANSVGQSPQSSTLIAMNLNTDNPWCQIDQNSHRVNTIAMGDTSDQYIWICTATTWQYTETEDDR